MQLLSLLNFLAFVSINFTISHEALMTEGSIDHSLYRVKKCDKDNKLLSTL